MHKSSWLPRAEILIWTRVKKPSNSTVHKLPTARWGKQQKEENIQPLLANIRSTDTLWLPKHLFCKLRITCPKMQRHQDGTVNTSVSPWAQVPWKQGFRRAEHPLYGHTHCLLRRLWSYSTWMDLLKHLVLCCYCLWKCNAILWLLSDMPV